MSASTNDNRQSTLIVERLHAVRERIARRLARPALVPPEIRPASLEPLRESRLAAARLAGAIGTVNPRTPGLLNELIQKCKRSLARSLNWLVRPQRDFNHAIVDSLARTSELLESNNRNLLALVEALAQSGEIDRSLGEEMDSVSERFDRRSSEIQIDLEKRLHQQGSALDARIGQQDHQFEEKMKLQKWALEGALARQSTALQDRMYEVVGEVQQLVLDELRQVRQRLVAQARSEDARTAALPARVAGAPSPMAAPATSNPAGLDYYQLERHFRGTEEEIRTRQAFYVPFFQGRQNVLDIACGRGEFLELMRDAGVNARGVDLDADMVGRCMDKGLSVVRADVFEFLEAIPDGSLDGIFCAQFVEHLEPASYVRLLMRCGEKLSPSGLMAVETQNPECLAIFSQSFYLDPTHVKPVPPGLLRVLFAEAGLDRITTHYLSPASAGLPVIPELASQAIEPEARQTWNTAVRRFNETFFGGMDYAVIGYRAGSRACLK